MAIANATIKISTDGWAYHSRLLVAGFFVIGVEGQRRRRLCLVLGSPWFTWAPELPWFSRRAR